MIGRDNVKLSEVMGEEVGERIMEMKKEKGVLLKME